jgi:hypothetical protein
MAVFKYEREGSKYEVTANSQEEADAKMIQAFGGEEEEATLGHKIGAMTDAAAQAITFNASDELAAGLKTGFGFLGDYDKAKAAEQARMEENRRLAPGYSVAGTVASLAIPSGMAMKGLQAAAKAPTILGKAGQAAKAGAVNAGIGAGYGTLSRLGDDQEINPVGDAAAGLMFGAGGKLISSAAGKMFNKSDALKRAQRRDSVQETSDQAFRKDIMGDIPVNPNVLRGVDGALKGATRSTKGMPAARAARATVQDLKAMTKPTPAKVEKGGIGFTQKISPTEVSPATPGTSLQMKDVNELRRLLNLGVKRPGAEKGRTKAAKDTLEANLRRMEPKKWADAESATKMYSDIEKAKALRKKVMSVKNVEGINRILEDKKLMLGVSEEVKQMLKDARQDPSSIRKVMAFISRMSPTTMVFNALRGNRGLAAAQASAYGVGKLSQKGFSDDLFRAIDDNFYDKYKKLEGDRVPNLEPVTALTGMGLLGNFGE